VVIKFTNVEIATIVDNDKNPFMYIK